MRQDLTKLAAVFMKKLLELAKGLWLLWAGKLSSLYANMGGHLLRGRVGSTAYARDVFNYLTPNGTATHHTYTADALFSFLSPCVFLQLYSLGPCTTHPPTEITLPPAKAAAYISFTHEDLGFSADALGCGQRECPFPRLQAMPVDLTADPVRGSF